MGNEIRFSVNGLLPISAVRNGHADATQDASERIRVEVKSKHSNDIYVCWFPALADTTVLALSSLSLKPMLVKSIPNHYILSDIFDPDTTKWDLRVSKTSLIELFKDRPALKPYYITESIFEKSRGVYALSIDQVCTDWPFVWATCHSSGDRIGMSGANVGEDASKLTSFKFACTTSTHYFVLSQLTQLGPVEGIVYEMKEGDAVSVFFLQLKDDNWVTKETMRRDYPNYDFEPFLQVNVTVSMKRVTVVVKPIHRSWYWFEATPDLKLLLSWLCYHINALSIYTNSNNRGSVITSEGERNNPALNRVMRKRRGAELEQRSSSADKVLGQFSTKFVPVVKERLLYDVQPSENGYTFFPFL